METQNLLSILLNEIEEHDYSQNVRDMKMILARTLNNDNSNDSQGSPSTV